MQRIGTTLLVALAIVTALDMIGGTAQARDLPEWVCKPGGPAAIDSETARSLSHNPTMTRVLQEYRARWDAAYIRQECDAAAAGRTANISCLQGRRDWNAIHAAVPSELSNASRERLRPLLRDLESESDGVREAFAHCRDLGVIK